MDLTSSSTTPYIGYGGLYWVSQKGMHFYFGESRMSKRDKIKSLSGLCSHARGKSFAMDRFTGEQRAFCVREYYHTLSYVTVRRHFRAQYRLHDLNQTPSVNIIKCWVRKFEATGSTMNPRPIGRHREVRSEQNIERVRDAVEDNPHRSVRKHAAALNIPRTSIQRILKQDLKLHPYKIQLVQALKETDYPLRLNYANKMLRSFRNFNKIIFSDEAHFHVDGYVNKQNCRYWSAENPREKHQRCLHAPKVTVWAGMTQNRHHWAVFL
ncbi:uncharacterized protein LOC124359719 [Homalodisca vitripennis]|uniref:uncharacterized protein LOC124359719 n=1 Tax=Homalodisca vitripennis TaxID=197043 RepID=UPI001EEB6D71|nr:uncharacterized protein LOC124359719 [Homalodisca vitripennis]